jgi:hypothetical protein
MSSSSAWFKSSASLMPSNSSSIPSRKDCRVNKPLPYGGESRVQLPDRTRTTTRRNGNRNAKYLAVGLKRLLIRTTIPVVAIHPAIYQDFRIVVVIRRTAQGGRCPGVAEHLMFMVRVEGASLPRGGRCAVPGSTGPPAYVLADGGGNLIASRSSNPTLSRNVLGHIATMLFCRSRV